MSNLASVEKEPEATTPGGFAAFTRIFRWWRHSSTSRDNAPQSAQRKPSDAEPKESPIRQQQVTRKKGFYGPLGIGEYVDSLGDGFEDPDTANGGSPFPPKKSRSLIDISMSNLWGIDDEDAGVEDLESGHDETPLSSGTDSRKTSTTSEKRPSVLSTISRLVPLPATAPNLVQFMDSPLTSAHLYESMETTFFGNSEDRWIMPAFVVTTCSQFQKGDMFNVS